MTQALTGRVGRGALVNLGFGVTLQGLAALQAVLVPRLLGPQAIGVFALATAGVALGTTVKSIDLPSKVVQERDVDLYTSYRVAFTLELMMAGAAMAGVMVLAPVIAHLYHRPSLWPLIAVLSLGLFQTALLDLPASLPYRDMRYARRNLITSTGPLVSLAVTLSLAYAGFGVWSLAAGTLSALAVSVVIVARVSPIRPALVWDRGVARRFLSFGWPIWAQSLLVFGAGWGAVISISGVIGVRGLGYFETSQNWSARALQVDGFLSDALFPAVCSMQSSLDRLRRAFVLTNRLSILWAAPVGLGMLELARPAVLLLLGHSWAPATILVRAEGISIILNAIGLNWRLFYVARGDTRPLLMMGVVTAAWLLGCVIPLLVLWRLNGAALAILLLGIFGLAFRQHYVNRLFGRLRLVPMVWRELATGLLAAGVVEGLRIAGWRATSVVVLGCQALTILALAGLGSWLADRGLIVMSVKAVLRPRPDGLDADSPFSDVVVARESAGGAGSFPMLIEADPDRRHLWVATRDRPALGRWDVWSREWAWTPVGVYPHRPTPDGRGGCWAALTRSRALVRVEAAPESGQLRVSDTRALPQAGDELLITAVAGDALWAVDSRRLLLWRTPLDGSTEPEGVTLPAEMRRPDYVAETPWGDLWVADTAVPVVAAVHPVARRQATLVAVPHPTRCVVADPVRGGCWLGASDRPTVSFVTVDGEVDGQLELPGTPFGMCLTDDGRLVAALKDAGAVAIVDPERETTRWVDLGPTELPFDVAFVAGRCFVTLAGSHSLAELRLPDAGGADRAWRSFPAESSGRAIQTALVDMPAAAPGGDGSGLGGA